MELERRVKTLEQEMKILKSQIQKTLLDIQEEVLIHYYPALRAESNDLPADIEKRRARAERTASRNERRSAMESLMPETSESSEPTAIKTTTLAEIRGRQNGGTRRDGLHAEQAAEAGGDGVASGWSRFAQLAAWAETSVERVGLARTQKLVEMTVGDQAPNREIKSTLLQLLSLYDEVQAPERGGMPEMADLMLSLKQLLNVVDAHISSGREAVDG